MGAAFEMLINAPLDAVFRNLFEYMFAGNPIRLSHALAHMAKPGEWPAVSLTGVIFGAALGFVLYRLREDQKRVESLRQEFEIQVTALRHHYKNLALGISGFSARARRKLAKLQQRISDSALADADIKVEIEALEQSVAILEDASRRLTSTLTEELTFLKALQSDGMTRRLGIFSRFCDMPFRNSWSYVSGIRQSAWKSMASLCMNLAPPWFFPSSLTLWKSFYRTF